MTRPNLSDRRTFLAAMAAATAGLAGCASSSDGADTNPRNSTDETTGVTTTTTTDVPNTTDAEEQTTAGPTNSQRRELAQPPDESAVLDTFDTFQADWTVTSGVGEYRTEIDENAETDGPYYGAGSVLLDSRTEVRSRIRRDFDEPKNLAGLDFSVAVRLLATTKPALKPHLVFRDVNGNFRVYSATLSSLASGRWIRLDLGVDTDDGIDMSAVTSMAVGTYTGDGWSRFYVDDIQSRPKPDVGHLILSFEDSNSREYDVAYPAISEYDMDAAAFAPSASINSSEDPSLAEYREMRDSGWLIGAHTTQHELLPDYDAQQQREILRENRAQLESKGFTEGMDHFRTTRGAYDTATLDVARDLFKTMVVPQGSSTGTGVRVTDAHMIGYKSGDDLQRSRELVDAAVEYRQLLGLTIHMRNQNDLQAFRSFVDYIGKLSRDGDLRVLTPDEHYNEFVKPRTNASGSG